MNFSLTPGRFLDLKLGILMGDCFFFSSQPRSKMKIDISSVELFSSCSPTEDFGNHKALPKFALCCSSRLCPQLPYYQERNGLIYIPLAFSTVLTFYLYTSELLKRLAQHIPENNLWAQNGIFHTTHGPLINSMSQGQKIPSSKLLQHILPSNLSTYLTFPKPKNESIILLSTKILITIY